MLNSRIFLAKCPSGRLKEEKKYFFFQVENWEEEKSEISPLALNAHSSEHKK